MYYRGRWIDNKVSYDDKGKMYIKIGMYTVREEKEGFVGVYKDKALITHTNNWKRATKTAKLLLDAYCDGYGDAGNRYAY